VWRSPTDGSILCFATQGPDSLDARRLSELTELCAAPVRSFGFDQSSKPRSTLRLIVNVLRKRPAALLMEGTGVWGGVGVLFCRWLLLVPYVVSSGDAVGPFLARRSRLLGFAGWLYELALYRSAAGFIGWSPYLVGRATTLGARRGMTAPGWAHGSSSHEARRRLRSHLGLSDTSIVFGLAGSLQWSPKLPYTYGQEIVLALRQVTREEVAVVVVGDGPGMEHLERMAGDDLGSRIHLVGRVPAGDIPDWLSAFDIASLPQSVDQVGSFRYTTKLPEYLHAGLPVVANAIPASYDLDAGWCWRLPGSSPWDSTYVQAIADLMRTVSLEEISARRRPAYEASTRWFDRRLQQETVARFLADVLGTQESPRPHKIIPPNQGPWH
jgi:hypothetical protein